MNLEGKVRVVPHFSGSAAMNLAKEEALFLGAAEELKKSGKFDPIVGLYSFVNPSVILGYRQPLEEIDLSYIDEHNIDVTMRKTGGGSVFLSPDEMQYYYILPFKYRESILHSINKGIQTGLGDAGFSAQIKLINKHHVLRMDEDHSFVFDAQRRRFVFRGDVNNPLHLFLHHGTILVDDREYGHMPSALMAPPKIAERLQTGNVWLRNKQQIGMQRLIKVLQRSLPLNSETYTKNFEPEEINVAQGLHDDYYSVRNRFSDGKKAYGICYLPGPDYDMNKYMTEEVSVK
jgi:hypothetical protein